MVTSIRYFGLVLAILIVISAVFFSGCITNTTDTTTQQRTVGSASAQASTTPEKGTIGATSNYEQSDGTTYNVTVLSVTKKPSYTWHGSSGTAYTENAPSGKQYLTVDTKFACTGSGKVYVSPSYFSVSDSTGAKYDMKYTSVDNELDSTTLYKGQNTRGIIMFEIPQSASGLKLMYDANPYSDSMKGVTVWNVT